MATATGTWSSNINAGFIDLARKRSKEPEKSDLVSRKERRHHYTFEVDDNGLDINGFIVQNVKHKSKRQRFRVYLDFNENGRFDKKDLLIGRTGLKQKHAAKGVGYLLDEDEIGQVEFKFKKLKSNASMRDAGEVDVQSVGGGGGRIGSMRFTDSDNAEIAIVKDTGLSFFVPPPNNIDDSKGLSTIKTLSSSGYSHLDDPEWLKGWQEHCSENAKPPYPEDCFFNIYS